MAKKPAKTPKVAAAVGAAVHTANPGGALAQALEAAMVRATLDAQKAGVTDPDEIRTLKQTAREETKASFGS